MSISIKQTELKIKNQNNQYIGHDLFLNDSIEAKIAEINAAGVAALNGIPASFTATLEDIAPIYSTSATYSVGDYVIHNGILYRCKVNINIPEPTWSSLKWQKVNLSQELNNLKNSTIQQIENIIANNFAQTYSPNSPYVIGDYVIHDNILYRCNTQIISGETWTSGHWTQVNTGTEIGSLKSEFDYCSVNLFGFLKKTSGGDSYITFSWTGNKCAVSGSTPSGTASFRNFFTDITSIPDWITLGKQYYIKYQSNNVRLRGYYYVGDAATLFLDTLTDTTFTIPSNATGILFRLYVAANKTVNETVEPILLETPLTDKETSIYVGSIREKVSSVDIIKKDVLKNNASNVLFYLPKTNGTSAGLTYTWNGDTCLVSGTSTGTSWNTIFMSNNSFPEGIEAGGTYIMVCESTYVNFAIFTYTGNMIETLVIDNGTKIFTIPSTATGLILRIHVWGDLTVNEYVTPFLLTQMTNKMLKRNLDTLEAKTIINKGALGDGVIESCDDIASTCIFFVTYANGAASIPDFPLGQPGWLETITTNDNISLQLAYPYSNSGCIEYRTKNLPGAWNNWRAVTGGTTTITQEVSRDTYNNTINISTSPTITTDSNGWLQPVDTNTSDETGKTDMSGAILSMLNSTGYCHLAPGIFYVSGNIDMPAGSMLIGCGKQTVIRLLQSVSSGYIVRMHTKSTIKDICFSGGYSDGDISTGNIGGRKGINYIGNRDGQDTGITPATCTLCMIDGCWFENLDSGIYGYNAGGGLQDGLLCNNCHFSRCKAGINLDYWVEYSKFTNCVMYQCYYACINNGGNNVFTACTFHGVVGFLIDNSSGTKANPAHGTVTGCTFNHIDNMNNPSELGKGIAIKVLDTVAGFIFTNCQIWYGRIHIEDSKGILISDCTFGGGLESSGYSVIETSGTETVFVSDCLFQTVPNFTFASPVKISNCWTYNGIAITV